MKIIVTWKTDWMENNPPARVVCINFESIEALKAHFQKEIENHFSRKREISRLWDDYTNYDGPAPTVAESNTFFVGNARFYYTYFCRDYEFTLPDMYSLNEWFDRMVTEEKHPVVVAS